MPGGFIPPVQPAPKRWGPLLAIILSVLVLLLVFGGVFVGISIGQAHSKTTLTQTVTTATPDASQLYRQVTSQNPSFTDSLQNASSSQWSVYEHPASGCEIKGDGLHIHISNSGHYYFCTSGRGQFSNFAFQVTMKILSGASGGIVFRSDNQTGSQYRFFIYPDGEYRVGVESKNKSIPDLRAGTTSSLTYGLGQTNILTVIAQSNQIYIYVNQKLLTQLQDSTYSTGYVGVLADDHDAPAEAVYTNAKIWQL